MTQPSSEAVEQARKWRHLMEETADPRQGPDYEFWTDETAAQFAAAQCAERDRQLEKYQEIIGDTIGPAAAEATFRGMAKEIELRAEAERQRDEALAELCEVSQALGVDYVAGEDGDFPDLTTIAMETVERGDEARDALRKAKPYLLAGHDVCRATCFSDEHNAVIDEIERVLNDLGQQKEQEKKS